MYLSITLELKSEGFRSLFHFPATENLFFPNCVFLSIISGITLVIKWTTFHKTLITSSFNWRITPWCWIIAYSMMYLAMKGSLLAR